MGSRIRYDYYKLTPPGPIPWYRTYAISLQGQRIPARRAGLWTAVLLCLAGAALARMVWP